MGGVLVSELRDGGVKGGVSAPRSRYELELVRRGRWNEGSEVTGRMETSLLLRVSSLSLSDSVVGVGESLLITGMRT